MIMKINLNNAMTVMNFKTYLYLEPQLLYLEAGGHTEVDNLVCNKLVAVKIRNLKQGVVWLNQHHAIETYIFFFIF